MNTTQTVTIVIIAPNKLGWLQSVSVCSVCMSFTCCHGSLLVLHFFGVVIHFSLLHWKRLTILMFQDLESFSLKCIITICCACVSLISLQCIVRYYVCLDSVVCFYFDVCVLWKSKLISFWCQKVAKLKPSLKFNKTLHFPCHISMSRQSKPVMFFFKPWRTVKQEHCQ